MAKDATIKSVKKDQSPRFGIGEWFGLSIVEMSATQRRYYATEVLKPKKEQVQQPCPFQPHKLDAKCSKAGGVCSLRLYSYAQHEETGRAMGIPVAGPQGELRATCPYRFHENLDVFNWVGEEVLSDANPIRIAEVGFLISDPTTDNAGGDDVGRIDMVLVKNDSDAKDMKWAALEIQAVYFSGNAMTGEFKAYSDESVDWIVFPAGRRHPDYRSSGPKRLMPQLQIKVPTLRRWGKKMAVVVDKAFFDSIGDMDQVNDISNADIAWFVVKFVDFAGSPQAKITRHEIRFTTLERSVEGLTGGSPLSLSKFEDRIQDEIVSGAMQPKPEMDLAEAYVAENPSGAAI